MQKFCDNCGEVIRGGGIRFCSQRCSRLAHKREYRKRNKEKVNAYNREYRKYKKGNKAIKLNNGNECFFCGTDLNLNWHHTNWSPETVIRLCRVCHSKLHWIREFEGTYTSG